MNHALPDQHIANDPITALKHAHHHDVPIPKPALLLAAALIVMVVGLATAVSFGWVEKEGVPSASRAAADVAPAQQRPLHFADNQDGSVSVRDANTDTVITTIPFGESGFVRSTARRLAQHRLRMGGNAAEPFVLTRWENGALSLDDPVTGKSAEIIGFGQNQTDAFAALLEDKQP